MILEVNGKPYSFFTDITVDIQLDTLARQFSFGATRSANKPIPFRGGDACRVLDGEDVIVTGHIERLDVDYSATTHRINLSGRGKTGDLIDSSITAINDLLPPATLKRCIQKVAENIGGSYAVVDLAGVAPYQSASDMIAPEPGANAFKFLEALARKRQVLLTDDGYGRIVITRAARTKSKGVLQNIVGADDNNILSSSTSYDSSGRFHTYELVSGLNPLAGGLAGIIPVDDIVNQRNGFTDSEIRRGRQLAIKPKSPQSGTVGKDRLKWEANIRKSRGRLYSVTVQGFRETPGGSLWEVNKIVRVVDEFAGINGNMLISGVSFSYDEQRGSLTVLTLVPSNAFTLQLNEPQTEDVGLGLTQ